MKRSLFAALLALATSSAYADIVVVSQAPAAASTGISTGVVTTAALTGNGNSTSLLGVNSSSVPVFQAGAYPAASGAAITSLTASNLVGAVPTASVNLSTVTTAIAALVPYTGANQAVNLGTNTLAASSATFGGTVRDNGEVISSGTVTINGVGAGLNISSIAFVQAGSVMQVSYPFPKTDGSLRRIAQYISNERQSDNPFELYFSAIGAGATAGRTFVWQTAEDGLVNGGILSMQNYGGNLGVGTLVPAAANKFEVGAGLFNVASVTGFTGVGIEAPIAKFQVASTVSPTLYVVQASSQNSAVIWGVTGGGVIVSSTTQGSLACDAGTGVMSATLTNLHGTFTAGAAATNCTYTFSTAWPKAPDCICADDSSILALKATATTTTVQCTAAVTMSNDNITFICQGAP